MNTRNISSKTSAFSRFIFVVVLITLTLGAHSFSQGNKAVNPGSYQLNFEVYSNGVYTPVTSLPVLGQELILRAYVADEGSGTPAQSGTAVFEYCSYKGRPPGDIERADEAPKEACDAGIASWRRLRSIDVNAGSCPQLGVGNACMNFGIVMIPRDVGFRFRFNGKRSGIDSGTSDAANFTWTAAP
jgi:hypothetical protein